MRAPRSASAALGAGLVVLILGALALRFGAAVGLTLALATPAADGLLRAFVGSPAREEITIPMANSTLRADLYRPATPRAALLLVHGLSRAGRHHPELGRLARLLAERGHLVLVPQFEGLAAFRLSGHEVDEAATALRHLRGLGPGRLGVAGFSFGAGPALLGAVHVPDLVLAGGFGGYADLRHVIAYVTTGVHTFAGRRYVQRQEEYNRWKLLALLAGFVEDARDRSLLEALADQKLANPLADGSALETALGDEGRRVLALARNRREEAVTSLVAALPPGAQAALDRLSPLAAMPRLPGRLLIAHGVGDDSIPFTESLRLAEAAEGRARVAILQSFHHTGPQSFWTSASQHARDAWSLFRLIDDLLSPP